MAHPNPMNLATTQPTFGERREAEHLAGYLDALLKEGKTIFYSEMDKSSHFAMFSATLEKPRTINNLAGGYPADYRLVLESTVRTPWGFNSVHSAPSQAFERWFQEISESLERYGATVGDFSTNSRMSNITLNFKTGNPAAIDALDGLIAERRQEKGHAR